MNQYNLIEKILFPKKNVQKEKVRNILEGKTVFITGASSGIGEQLTKTLATCGAKLHLIIVARREERLLQLQQVFETEDVIIDVIQADLRVEDHLENVIRHLHQLPNGLDIFVNNAGLSINRSIDDSLERMHDFKRTMAINYFAPVQLLLSIIPLLQKSKGQIINVSTINALLYPMPKWAAYQASKIAFDTWLKSAAPELEVKGILSTSIYLPLVRTPMIEPTKAYEYMPAMTTEHVVNILLNSIVKSKRSYKPWWVAVVAPISISAQSLINWFYTYQMKRKGRK